jgi:hypothetical protein
MKVGPFEIRLPFSFAGMTLLSNPAALTIFKAKEPVKRRRLESVLFFSKAAEEQISAPQRANKIGYRWLVGL